MNCPGGVGQPPRVKCGVASEVSSLTTGALMIVVSYYGVLAQSRLADTMRQRNGVVSARPGRYIERRARASRKVVVTFSNAKTMYAVGRPASQGSGRATVDATGKRYPLASSSQGLLLSPYDGDDPDPDGETVRLHS